MSSPGEARSREKISSLALVLTRVHVCVCGGGGEHTQGTSLTLIPTDMSH